MSAVFDNVTETPVSNEDMPEAVAEFYEFVADCERRMDELSQGDVSSPRHHKELEALKKEAEEARELLKAMMGNVAFPNSRMGQFAQRKIEEIYRRMGIDQAHTAAADLSSGLGPVHHHTPQPTAE